MHWSSRPYGTVLCDSPVLQDVAVNLLLLLLFCARADCCRCGLISVRLCARAQTMIMVIELHRHTHTEEQIFQRRLCARIALTFI